MLNRALHANRRGSGLLITLTRLCGGTLALVPVSAAWRIALKIAFMLFLNANGEMLGMVFQLQVDRLTLHMQTNLTLSGIQPG